MNVGQIKTGVKRFGFDDTDPLLDWINEANAQFNEAFDWPWLKQSVGGVTVPGTPYITPAGITQSEVIDRLFIILTNPTRTIPLDYFNYSEYISNTQYSDSGIPCRYTSLGANSYFIYPVPDAVYSYQALYTLGPETFTADANVPIMPLRYHYALVRGAAAIGLDSENQEERSDRQQQRFQEIIDRAMAKYATEQKGTFSRIRDVRGD